MAIGGGGERTSASAGASRGSSATRWAASVGGIGAILAIADGVAYELPGSELHCICPTMWHPGSLISLVIGGVISGVILILALVVGRGLTDARRGTMWLFLAALAASAFGDQFWIGTFPAMGVALAVRSNTDPARGTLYFTIAWAVVTGVARGLFNDFSLWPRAGW